MDDKIIVSHRGALKAKYSASGLAAIKEAVDRLIRADAKRGVRSRLVHLDDAAAMKGFGGHAVTDARDAKQSKDAVDAIFRKADPEYLMILGAPDVVPHQDMRNSNYRKGDDPDPAVPGDLPYACDTPYSRDPASFTGPTRVVGRLPDLAGAKEPSYLIAVLGHAAKHAGRPAAEFRAYFGLSTVSWRKSTGMSLDNIFGDPSKLMLVPPTGPTEAAKRLSPLMHFINCHGATASPEFLGQKGKSYPTALTSDALRGKIRPGTVAAVECCYGAELYDSVTLSLPIPICQNYLLQGSSGYLGSSTVAFGPATGNGLADIITQEFLLSVLDGASIGRAALVARQRFVDQAGELDPVDLKTLAQFSLLGDPSLVPVVVESATAVPKGVDAAEAKHAATRANRVKLRAKGEFLRDTKPTASRVARAGSRSRTVREALAKIASEAGIAAGHDFTAYAVSNPARGDARGAKSSGVASRYYVSIYRPGGRQSRLIAAVAKEVDGRIVGYRVYEEK